MTKEQFQLRLKEDKFFDNPEEMIQYRLPVLQYYLDNYNQIITMQFQAIWPMGIKINRSENDFTLINKAFNSLVERFNKGRL